MTSPPLDSTHNQTMSGVACHHRLWAANTIEKRRDWNDITAFGQDTRSNDVGHGMTSPLWDRTHGQTTSGMACHHRHWAAHTVERRWAWHDITALGLHTRSNNVRRGMQSSHLGSTCSRTASIVAFHHRPCTVNMVERRRAWHAIIAFGQHTQLDYVGVA